MKVLILVSFNIILFFAGMVAGKYLTLWYLNRKKYFKKGYNYKTNKMTPTCESCISSFGKCELKRESADCLKFWDKATEEYEKFD